LIKFLGEKFDNPATKETFLDWIYNIKGVSEKMDKDKTLAYVLGTNDSEIKKLRIVGDRNIEGLQSIDNGNSSLSAEHAEVADHTAKTASQTSEDTTNSSVNGEIQVAQRKNVHTGDEPNLNVASTRTTINEPLDGGQIEQESVIRQNTGSVVKEANNDEELQDSLPEPFEEKNAVLPKSLQHLLINLGDFELEINRKKGKPVLTLNGKRQDFDYTESKEEATHVSTLSGESCFISLTLTP